jgi:hypothetical protein
MAQMLKEEPKLLYIYEVMKKDPTYPYHRVGEWIETEYDKMDKEFYRMVGTYRRAFIGDMQEKFDKAWMCKNMEQFAKSVGNNCYRVEYRTREVEANYSIKGLLNHFIINPYRKFKFKLWLQTRRNKKEKEERNEYLEYLLSSGVNNHLMFEEPIIYGSYKIDYQDLKL